jgi:hypothetical protein
MLLASLSPRSYTSRQLPVACQLSLARSSAPASRQRPWPQARFHSLHTPEGAPTALRKRLEGASRSRAYAAHTLSRKDLC